MQKIEQFFDDLFGLGGNIALAFIRRLAPFAVPLAPAFFLAHAVATSANEVSGGAWGTAVGVVAALGLESAGILGAHLAVRFYAAGDGKWQVAALATAVYLLIGIGAIWLLDGTSNDAKAVGTAMFLIAGIVYLLLGLSEDEAATETAVADDREFGREVARKKLAYAHEQKLARIAANPAPQTATAANHAPQEIAATPQAATAYECACGRVFDRPHSYSAHTRHCETHKRVAANGHVK